jgi:hypothetical protein
MYMRVYPYIIYRAPPVREQKKREYRQPGTPTDEKQSILPFKKAARYVAPQAGTREEDSTGSCREDTPSVLAVRDRSQSLSLYLSSLSYLTPVLIIYLYFGIVFGQ